MANHYFLLLLFCTSVLQTVINSQHVCDFEKDLCNWNSHKSIDITWKRKEGKSNKHEAETLADHTTGSGSYLHLEYQNLTEKNVAQIFTPAFLQMDKSYCLSFYYYMSGKFDKVLYIYRYSNNTQLQDEEVIALEGSQDENWRLFQTSFKTERENRLMFEAHLEGPTADISIDDVQLKEGYCPESNEITNYESLGNNTAPPTQLPFSCDFQDNICGFKMMSGILKWRQGHGTRSYFNNGPVDDHTFRTRSGIYLYASAPWKSKKRAAHLVSPEFSGKDQICVQFWYNMYGENINKLEVIIRNQTVWYAAGDQGYGWKVAYVSVLPGEDFNITFNAWSSLRKTGYMAIDDVRLEQGNCTRPDICTFEGAMCSWTNSKRDSLDWVETKGSKTRRIGPSSDHTVGTTKGTYLFLDASKSKAEDTRALLTSESFSMRVKTKCLQFFYHMKGNVGQLTVYKENEDHKTELLWTLVGDQGPVWHYASIEIRPQPNNFYLVVEGIVGLNNTGGIAIDDFAMTSIKCKTTPSKANLQKPLVKTTRKSITPSHATIEPGKVVMNCNFLNNTCKWIQGHDDTSDWIRTQSKNFGGQGPIADHTSANGFYMNLPSNVGQTAHLHSQIITPVAGHPMCLSFWYYMYGPNIETFKVYITKSNLKEKAPHWVRVGTQGNQWQQGKLLILQTRPFKITFEGKVKQSTFGNIAIDDILLIHGTCNELTTRKPDISVPLAQRSCNFEANDICGFSVENTTDFRWSQHSGSTDTLGTGPTNDHTLESSSGHYMYVSAMDGNVTTKSSLISPFYKNTDSVCLQFYYHMYGDGIGTLNIYTKVGNTMDRIYHISGNQANKWQVDTATIDIAKTSKNLYRVIFEAVKGPNKRGDIALDDISFTLGACSVKGDCDFEDPNCLWTNVQGTGDNFDWIKLKGPATNTNTGPKFDHTQQNAQGHYQYIEKAKGNDPGRAWLVSPLFQPLTSDKCLQFWYNMNGKDISRLSVVITVAGSSNITIWQLEGNQGKAWLQGQVSLPRIKKPYSVVFEGINGKEQGGIALDDITFINEGCRIIPSKAYVKRSMTTVKPAATKAPVDVSTSCTFTKDYCGWKQDKSDDGDWLIGLSEKASMKDHTGDDGGRYIFVKHLNQPNKKFRLISPDFTPTSDTSCVTFWYYKYGYSSNSLRMYIKEGLNLPSSPVLAVNGFPAKRWEREMYSVHINKTFNVVFEIRSDSFGITALDDVSITHGACKNDFSQSLSCDFENKDICGFQQDTHGKKPWVRHQGSTSTLNTGPLSDHTYRSNKGHYMFVEGSNTKPNSKVRLFSPVIKLDSSSSCVEFYFNMKGNVGMLSIYLLSGNRASFLWNRFGHQNSDWQLSSIQINSHKQYQIYFQAIVGGKYDGDIAIDDFTVRSGQCNKQGTCNFENGICDWEMSDENDFDWLIQKADVKSKALGPLTDHTNIKVISKGHYLMAKSNSGQAGSISKLVSTDFNPTVNCLHLWYNIYGKTPATMTVYKKASNTSILWQLTDEQEGNWKEAQVPISNTSEVFSIVIEVKSGSKSYVAIDDTHFNKIHDCARKPSNAIAAHTTAKRSYTTKPATVPQTDSFKSCTFSTGFCGWQQLPGSKVKWQMKRGKTATQDTGPKRDHTTGTGNYIYIETSNPVVSGDSTHLISPKFQVPGSQEWCLSFWYHMYGYGIGTLSVVYRGKSDVVAWQKRKSQGNKWINGQVNIRGPQELQIIFEVTKGKSFTGDIALDDIMITPKQCSEAKTSLLSFCDFESTCSLFQSVQSTLNWQLTTNTYHRRYRDHTYKSTLGDYIYVDLTKANKYSDARFNMPTIHNRTVCVEFFYRALGSFTGRLTVFRKVKDETLSLLKIEGNDVPNEWAFAELEVQSYGDLQLSFYVLSGKNPIGGIAIDDIAVANDHCKPPASCDFEKEHLCHWKNSLSNRHDWLVHSGGTDSRFTGPSADHTTGKPTGSYIYIEASNQRRNEKVRIVSEPLTNNGFTPCFLFWYNMYGNGIGQLNIYIQDSDQKETLLWTLKGDQGKSWQIGKIPLITSKSEYRVVIEGSTNSVRGDIAIDDIYTIPQSCSFFPSRAQAFFEPTTQSPATTTENTIETDVDEMCTFEKGMCIWAQSQTDQFEWKLRQGYTPNQSIGPQGDHTTGSGHYLYIDTAGQAINSRAQLFFTYTPTQNKTRCLKFWYNMRGQHVDYLNVYIQYGTGSNSPAWSRRSDQGPNWQLAQINFDEEYSTDMKIIIEGVKGGNTLSNIAIDDITLTNDGCKEPIGKCDFETRSLCGYQPDSSANFKWIWRTGYKSWFSTAPNKDHTYGSSNGHYMHISSRSPRKPKEVARLLSPKYDAPEEDHCVQFYYNIYGRNVGSLNIKLRIHDTKPYDTDSYLQIKGDQQKGWILGMVEVPKMIENPYQIIFEGVIGTGPYGDIAIDDITVTHGECEVGGDCDFDHGRCTWTNMAHNRYNWLVGSGSTATSNTGPVNDHTFQNSKGFYLFIDATYLKQEDKSRYISQMFPALHTERRCFTFWYSMNGNGIGILKILTKFETGSNVTIWELSRDQGNKWLYGQAPIQSHTEYQIIIEATRGRTFEGDLAIDDIIFKDSDCSVLPHTAAPKDTNVVIPTGIPPKNTETTKPFNCSFDDGICGWTQDPQDDFDWSEMAGKTQTWGTGPSSDHGGKGHYLYIEASNKRKGQKARLVSPLVKSVGMVCVSVYYYMYGSDIKDLKIYVMSGSNSPQQIFAKSGSSGRRWNQAQVQFQTLSPFNIILEATRGRGNRGDIAIDDVAVNEGFCTRQAAIGSGKYYNFESRNRMAQMKDDDFDWKLGSGWEARHSSRPSKDHTFKTSRGHYMYIRGNSRLKPDDKAVMSTPAFYSQNSAVCVTFWYFLYGKASGSLMVQYVSEQDGFTSPKVIWMKNEDQGNQWNEANLNIDDHSGKHIRIEFVGIAGPGYSLNVAIDDVFVSNKPCTIKPDSCNFEKGKCEWENKNKDDFDWVLSSGKYTSLYGPSKDHTTSTTAGSYLFLEPTIIQKYDSSQSNQAAILESQQFSPSTSKKCFEFYYYINKAKNSSLQMFSSQNGDEDLIWHLAGHQGSGWMKGQTNLKNIANPFRVKIKGNRGPNYAGDIALDDMKFTTTKQCATLPPKASPDVTPTTTASPLIKIPGFNCSFDKNLCGWKNSQGAQISWKRTKGSTRNSDTGPSSDHNGGGYYMYIESSFFSGFLKHYADLISPTFSTTQKACISFYYHMFGENINSLRLILAPKKVSAKYIWLKNGPQKNKWLQGTVTIPAVSSSNIVFRGVSGFGSSGDIAIDDVTIHAGECQEDISSNAVDCDFESSDGCQYLQDKSVDYRWKKYSGYGSPFRDHTKKSVFGHFMGAGSRRISSGKIARLWTPQFALKDGQCLSFWYHMYGSRIGTLNVHVTNVNAVNRIGAAVWTRRGHQGRSWFEEYIPLPNFINAFVIFESINRGDIIGIDDIKLLNSTCPEPGDCHFEISSCGWHNDGNNTVNWERMSGRTIYRREHRYIRDHTYSSIASSMMYIGVSKSKMKTKGDLVSISFDKTSGSGLCIKFWYIISGTNIGSLSVIMQTSNQSTLMWKLSDSQGSGWSQGTFFIKSDSSFTLSIRAEIEENANGFLALDDINYNSLRCAVTPIKARPLNQPSTTSKPVTMVSTIATSVLPPGPYDCTFESKNFCGWTQDQSNLKWIISKGSRYGYDPIVDHTLKTSNGNFALFRYKRTRSIQFVKLLSPPIHNYTLTCFSFWFHLYGNRVHSLSVQHMTSNKVFTQVWYHSQPLSRKWHPASITLGLNENDKIAFQVDSRSYLSGSVALDDIKLTPGHCHIKESCGFEDENLCEFVQMKSKGNFYWKVRDEKAPPIDTQILPRYDHTEDSLTGHYMYLRNSHVRSSSARLFSKVQRKTSGSCVSFWYSIGGTSNSMRFRVYSLITDIYRNLWTRSSRTGKTWNQAEVTVKSNTHWQVAFLGYSTRLDKQSYIALDDVKITSGSCPLDGDCNFEKDMCSWSNSNQDNFDWLQTTAANNRAGPKVDHSEQTAQGSYIYVLPKWPIQTGEKAVLVSDPIAPVPRRRCMSFWYYMKGNSAGELEVGYANESVLWRISDDQGDKWHLGKVPLSITNRFKKMTISASAGAGSRSIIAIDEISFDLKPCGLYPINAKPVLRPSTPSAPTTPTSPPSTFKPNSKFDCSFENGFCSWGQSRNDIFNWTLQQGPTDSSGTGPNVDHTYGSKKGHYIYIESSYPRKRGDTAILTSASFSKNINYTLEFYYHMYGSTIGGLNVTMTLDGQQQSQLLWSQRRSQARAWIKAELSIPPQNVPFAISLVGIIGWSVYGDIAIDDIRVFTTEQTEAPLNCTFEASGICKFSTPSNGNYRWKKHTGIARYPSHAPSFDHTSGTPYGHYMVFENLWAKNKNSTALLITPTQKSSSDICMSFYYYMHGYRRASLNVYQQINSQNSASLWMDTTDQGSRWVKAQVTMPASQDYKVIFEGVLHTYGAYVAVDDISSETGECPDPGDTDFEDDMGTWSNIRRNDVNWIRATGQMPYRLPHPAKDHTMNSMKGHYIFLASDSKSQRKGILRSEVFPATNLRCLHFWFYLDGTSPGGITVYFVDEETEAKTAIWALSSAQGNSWNYAQTAFAWKDSYYVEFEGITNQNHDVYTALDDIMFLNDYCAVQPLEAQTKYKFLPKTNTTSAPVITDSAIDCTFEKDYCKWTHNKSDVFLWQRKQGPTDSSSTGPQTDHTYGNSSGYYIYIETSRPRRQDDTASLISSPISPISNGCFRFWYHMYGADVDTLTVYNASGKSRSPLWRKQGTVDEFWHQAIIEINFEKSTQIVLEGKRGKSFSGDISIDDVSFSKKQCPSSSDFLCDYEETSICGFVQSQKDKFDWVRQQGASYSRNSGPSSDHTFGTWQGHYMYIKSVTHGTGDNAILQSPEYKSTGGKCANFWYHMYGSQIGQLKVHLKTPVSKQLLWKRHHAQGNFWSLAQVKIAFSGTFHLEFEAITEKGSQGNIAIDDFSLTEGQCPKAGNIDFEKGLTTWMNVIDDDFDWLIGTGKRYYNYDGPRKDHTLKTFYGHYLLLRALSPFKPGDHALLISESLDGSMHQCMRFWYRMSGQGIGTLRFIMVQLGSNVTSWVLSGSQSTFWRLGRFPIASNKPFQIIIEGVRGSSNRVNFAIDDIEFNNKKCSLFPRKATELPTTSTIPSSVTTALPPRTTPTPTQYDCTFEKDMCSWTNDVKADFKWARAQGPSGHYKSGPTTDHTSGTKDGWYILSKRSWRSKSYSKARIVGPSIPPSQTRCLNFWYHMYGAYVNQLQVNVTQGTTTKKLWVKTGDQGNLWRQAFIHMDKSAYKTNYKITFEAVGGINYRDFIALDDIRFTVGACHENNPTFCDFESEDKCNYTHNKNADFEWTWHHGRTQSSGTGPTADHTMGTPSGHYFYIETSSKKVNQTAQLISPMYHTDTPTCLHFYYFMYGDDINTLNIYQAFGNQFDELKSPLWNMEHSQGPNWIEGTVTLAAHGNYTVIFEGISGKGFRGDIAIDDIFQTNGSCQTPGFCDFENGPCNWRNDKLDDFDWVIGQGLTLTDQTGPIYDHTYNNAKGHYMYIDSSSPIRPGDVAHLLSEHLSANKKPGCLKFWYQMYGKDVNALNVLVRKSFGFLRHYDAAFIWTVNGNQGQKWFSAQVYIDPKYTGMSHQLIFEAIRGNGSYGDIAIDDISISQESCSIKPIYADPQKSEFQEVSCSFDMSFCQWYLDSKSDFNWTLAGYYKRIKPRTGSGSYIYIKSFQSKKGSNAMIHTTLLAPTSTGGNCLSFWYYMYGSNIGTLNVYMTKFGRKVLIWTKRGSQENQWNYAHLNVENDYNFMLYIEFVTNGRSTGMVAVDDIFMDTNGCPHPRSCDFEVDTCGWTIETKLTNLWRKSTYFSQIPDHTTGTKSGHYVYASSSRYGRRTKIARLTSPPFPPASQSCLRFWYNMNVQNSSALQLYVKTGFFKRQVWERTGNQGKEWWQGHANIVVPLQQLGVTYKLTFQSVQDSGHSEIIAVDDIEHLPGPCDPQGLCDFEQGMCGFTNVYGDDFDWIVFSGSKQSFVSGPTEDHTTNSPSGHYMYIDTRFNRNENDRAWLSSWENEPTNATCVSFWYHMYGKGMGDLNVFYKNSQSNRTIWHLSGNQGNIWLLGNFTIISPTTYVIIFEGVRGKTYTSDIALDDIRFQNGTCESIVTVPTTTVAPVKRDIFFQCTFEYGLCGWQIDSTTNAEFMISYGVFIYKRGGPRSDHTLGNHFGHYLLLNNSQSTTNRTARFISTDIHITRPICITFWYYMRITNFGQLNVYVHNNGEKKPPIWTRSGTQGYYWLHASIDVANPEKSNKVYFEAIRNHGYYGIALDDIKILIGSCPEINECDFEEVDICGFEQGTTDKFNWTRGSHSTARRSGPQSDHTYKSFYGHYMYLNTEKHTKDDHAHLYTPQYPATQTERCLSFWYYMDGTYEDKINVYLYQNNKITTKLWFIQTSQGPHWRLATVSINSQTPFQVLFEGIRGYNSRVIIALDDVKVSQTACEPLASCNFEEGFCGWFNNHLTIGRSMNWVIRTGHYRRTKLEPPIDHTAGDSSGSYAHIYSSRTSKGRAAYLESQMVPYEESPRFCFHFWHYMYGTDAGLLTVYVHYHGRSLKAIWTRNNTISHQWVEEHVTVGSQYINFEMVIGSIAGSNGSIAIDDVMLMKGLCPNEQEEKFTCKSGQKISKEKVCDFIFDCPDYDDEDNCGSCSFEDDMCTWTDISHGSFEWVRGRNGNNITESGPSIDHTMGTANGWFAYIHSSNGTRTRYASLENRVIQQTSSTCELNFWYYISSTSFANNINVVLHESDITTSLIRYASRSNVWQQATVAIGKVSRPFRLMFYGTRSLSGRSDVAIDDISLTDCNFPKAEEHCEKYEFHCKNKACIDSSQVCDLSNDCGDGSDEGDCDDFNSCDFDFGLCDWSQDWNDDFDWTRTNGETLSYSTGPKRDHSTGTGTGYYIYTEASSPRKKGENARLYSPVIAPTSSNECWIRFFYHMNGFQMGTLNVYTRTSVLGKYKKLWTKTGHVADYWERADVKLTSNQKFQVVFESIIGGFSSDIALDDITFLPGCDISNNNEKLPNGTEPKTTPNPCPIGLYACRDRTGCIQYTNVCDFEKNCNDNSDEDVCGDCDFESGLCGWTDYSTGKFKWASHQGDAMGKIGPAKDHTNSSTGKYMRVFPNSGVFPTPAVISTRPYGETGKHCVIQFYVFLSGDDIGVLNLNMIDPVTGKLLKNLYSEKKNLGNAWVKESVKIGAHKRGFSLQFQALPETHSKPFTITTDIAVDDLKLINCDPAPIRIYTTPTTTSGKHSKTTPGKHIKTTPGNHITSKPGKTTSSSSVSTTHKSIPGKPTTHKTGSSSGRISATTTTASTTPPIKCNPDEFSCRTQNGFECFPTAYHCDGRKDCLNGEDENSCKVCPKGHTYCKPQHKCISSTRCNGISDCEDNSDESLCQTCRPDMCQKGGPCQVKDGIPQCSCGNLTVQTNFRCLIPKFERITSHPSHKKTWAIPVGIILALIMVGALVFGIYFFWKRRTQRNYSPSVSAGIDNPMYNYDFKMTELEPPSFSNTAAHGDSTAIENPLYSDLK
ncbi:MAM and LDL-receptor class A domain-containing protein 1-like isoform X2 [Octopus sinensis]|uniref:MAM and LDL-receptor class A domain-containing protein 1-like isoform X2 n=1 Tax=Octopus sinensis TaxID=2607531 RepID=A0A7E6EZI6_9MOLL|nr:MAM and LDL-receptor class A domain-containing protein 1-like isoform X2 [Octopus sinensis]